MGELVVGINQLSLVQKESTQSLVQKEPPKREARGLWALPERLKIGTGRQTNLKRGLYSSWKENGAQYNPIEYNRERERGRESGACFPLQQI
jgi:hypothetical protein